MGRYVVHFNCHHCAHCCTDVVCLPTPWDVIRIVKHTGQHPYDFLEFLTTDEIEEVEADDPAWLECNGDRYMMALKRSEKTGCHFLHPKTKYCTIYEARPILCRLYPFKLEESDKDEFLGFSLHDDVGCPRNRDGIYATDQLYALYQDDSKHQQDYEDLVAHFNRRRGKNEPRDFLGLFIEGL